jgi:transposase
VFVIGIDPHKGSHSAAVLDHGEGLVGEIRVRADRGQRQRLLDFAGPFAPRVWAIEGATGTGALLAQQLVAAGEIVLDVPPRLSARVRALDSESSDKTDAHDARAAAVVALRHRRLRQVTVEDHAAVLRILAKRHHELTALRTQSICRLHAVLCQLTPGGLARNLTATRAGAELRRLRITDPVGLQRRQAALELLAEVRRSDAALAELKNRIQTAVRAADTTVTQVFGVGPIMAARTNDTASTFVATDSSTTPCTWRQSPRSATTPPAASTTSPSWPRSSGRRKPSGPSSGASATPSTASSSPTRPADNGPGRATRGDSQYSSAAGCGVPPL